MDHTVWFNHKFRYNIQYGAKEHLSEEDIISACQKANAMEFIEKLEHGLGTDSTF